MTFRADRYPKNWREIRASIVARAEHRCECTGECGEVHEHRPDDARARCSAPNGLSIVRDTDHLSRWWLHGCGSGCTVEPCGAIRVVLTVAHLDHIESNNDPANLRALCQRCHLLLDREDNARRRRERRDAEQGPSLIGGRDG